MVPIFFVLERPAPFLQDVCWCARLPRSFSHCLSFVFFLIHRFLMRPVLLSSRHLNETRKQGIFVRVLVVVRVYFVVLWVDGWCVWPPEAKVVDAPFMAKMQQHPPPPHTYVRVRHGGSREPLLAAPPFHTNNNRDSPALEASPGRSCSSYQSRNKTTHTHTHIHTERTTFVLFSFSFWNSGATASVDRLKVFFFFSF